MTPQFDIKGSVSQFDENVIRNQRDLGFGIQPFLNLGVSRDAATSVLGLDLSVLTTDDMAILPGVTSRNSVVILKQGSGTVPTRRITSSASASALSLSKSVDPAGLARPGRTGGHRADGQGLTRTAVLELPGRRPEGERRDPRRDVRLVLRDGGEPGRT